MADKDEMVVHFCSATGVEADFASELLSENGWDFERAMNAFFGEGDSSNGGSNNKNSKMDVDDSSNNFNQNDETSLQQFADSLGVDLDTARAIREAEGGSSSSSGSTKKSQTQTSSNEDSSFIDQNDPDYVRAPIKPTVTRLISGGGAYRSAQELDAAQMMNQFSPSFFDAVKILQQSVENSQLNQPPPPGNDIYARFSPGRDIVFQGTIEQARGVGKKTGKPILINIQDESDLSSLNLNRDVWRDEVISSLIKDSFIFFQREKSQSDSAKFMKLYKIDQPLPFIGIVDAKTGALLCKLKIKGKENELRDMILEQLSIFLESQEAASLPPMRNINSSPATTISKKADSQTSNSSSLSDTQMGGMSPSPTPPLSTSIAPPSMSSIAAPSTASHTTTTSTTPSPSIAAPMPTVNVAPEPAAGDPNSITLQFINFNGQKFQRRFIKTQTVEDVYSFISTKSDGKSFDLLMTYPNVSLNEKRNQTLEESGLSKVAIRCKYAS